MLELIFDSILLGLGLSMDACAVSMVDGLKENNIKITKTILISLIFSLFQTIMPLIGYFVGSLTIARISWIIPIVALTILSIIGIRMIIEGVKREDINHFDNLTYKVLFMQAIATSIDALTVGFTIADYHYSYALISVAIIGIVTFLICLVGVFIGKKLGLNLGDRAQIFGGIILVIIGIEIFIKGVFF